MQHRINLFVMFATGVGLCAMTGASTADVDRFEAVYSQMPGGEEAVPRFTRFMLGWLKWLGTWWPLCLLVGAGVFFGLPVLLRRKEGGERFLAAAASWMTKYQGTVMVAFVAAMFWTYWAIDVAIKLPYLRIIDQLTGN